MLEHPLRTLRRELDVVYRAVYGPSGHMTLEMSNQRGYLGRWEGYPDQLHEFVQTLLRRHRRDTDVKADSRCSSKITQ